MAKATIVVGVVTVVAGCCDIVTILLPAFKRCELNNCVVVDVWPRPTLLCKLSKLVLAASIATCESITFEFNVARCCCGTNVVVFIKFAVLYLVSIIIDLFNVSLNLELIFLIFIGVAAIVVLVFEKSKLAGVLVVELLMLPDVVVIIKRGITKFVVVVVVVGTATWFWWICKGVVEKRIFGIEVVNGDGDAIEFVIVVVGVVALLRDRFCNFKENGWFSVNVGVQLTDPFRISLAAVDEPNVGDEDEEDDDDAVHDWEHFVILLIDGVVVVDVTVSWIGVSVEIGKLIREDDDGYDDGTAVVWGVEGFGVFTAVIVIPFNCFVNEVWFKFILWTGFLFTVWINKWLDWGSSCCCCVGDDIVVIIGGVTEVRITLRVFKMFVFKLRPLFCGCWSSDGVSSLYGCLDDVP